MAFREGLASAVSDVDVSRACAPHRCAQGALMDEKGPLRAAFPAFL